MPLSPDHSIETHRNLSVGVSGGLRRRQSDYVLPAAHRPRNERIS
jgi:hypothetical protein